jgi:hypothetical protein
MKIKGIKENLKTLLLTDPICEYAKELCSLNYTEKDVVESLKNVKGIPEYLIVKLLNYMRDIKRGVK